MEGTYLAKTSAMASLATKPVVRKPLTTGYKRRWRFAHCLEGRTKGKNEAIEKVQTNFFNAFDYGCNGSTRCPPATRNPLVAGL